MRFPDKHLKNDKFLLRLERELNRLRHAQWRAPIIPLEHPYQRGWIKTYVLREDVLHHLDAPVFQTVLGVVNQSVLSRNREFTHRPGQAKVLRPKIIPVQEWVRRPWSLKHQRLFAYGAWDLDDIHPWTMKYYRSCVRGFKLISTWWLHEEVSPHMITHQRVDLPEVRSRIAEIESYFIKHLGYQRLNKLHGHRSCWHGSSESANDLRATSAIADQET